MDYMFLMQLAGINVALMNKHFYGTDLVLYLIPNGVDIRLGVIGKQRDTLKSDIEKMIMEYFPKAYFETSSADMSVYYLLSHDEKDTNVAFPQNVN